MLVLAHPLHTNGPADGLRHQRGIFGSIVGFETAVTTGAFAVDEVHVVLANPEQPRDAVARDERRLRSGPDRRLVALHVGNGTGGTDHAVHLEWPSIRRVEGFRRLRKRSGCVAGVGADPLGYRLR